MKHTDGHCINAHLIPLQTLRLRQCRGTVIRISGIIETRRMVGGSEEAPRKESGHGSLCHIHIWKKVPRNIMLRQRRISQISTDVIPGVLGQVVVLNIPIAAGDGEINLL